MRYRFARSSRIVLVALLPACGGGDFSTTSGRGASHAGPDAASDGPSSGGMTGDGARPGGGGSGGSGNSSGGEGSGGRQAGDGGANPGGNKSSGGSPGNSGSDAGSDTDAGAGGTMDGGAGSGGSMNSGGINGAGGACPDPITWYVDNDQDGYGAESAPKIQSCEKPQGHYTKVGGDCQDEERSVHPQLSPQEKKYFGTAYKTLAGVESYDYDCSGVETGDPSPSQPRAAMCSLLTLGGCGGSGYSPGTRGGIGTNAYCGSQKFQTCKGSLTCTGTIGQVTTPYACN